MNTNATTFADGHGPDPELVRQIAQAARGALALAGMSLDHMERNESQRFRDTINNLPDDHSVLVAAILNSVARWIQEAADDRAAEAEPLLAHNDPWDKVLGAAIACETATLTDLASEAELAATLVRNPNTPDPDDNVPALRTATPTQASDRGSITRSGLKWYRRAWDSADADGSVHDVVHAVNDPETVTPDPAGHGRTRLSRKDITVVMTPDGVILAWWRGNRD